MILMRSPKGGVGTTFLTARLAIALAGRGLEVSAIDCTRQDSLKLFFEISPTQELEVLGSALTSDAVSGVQLFRADMDAEPPVLADLLRGQCSDGRVCIVDLGAAPMAWGRALLPPAAIEICPLVPSPVALAALTQVDDAEPVLSLTRTAFILNQLDDRRRLSNDIHKLVRTLFGDQLLGTVRRDEAVNEALAAMKPLAAFAPASAALSDIEQTASTLIARLGLGAAPDRQEAVA